MRKNKESEITLSETKATSTQTPIEIALKIDENGMTTASQLYSFLQLNPSNFSKWCNHNIKNNKFATENVDYFRFVLEYESANNIKTKTRTLDMKGEIHTYQDMNNQGEKVHLMLKDFTYGFMLTNIENFAKVTLQ